eukprot:COSAG01_NODE_508_length_16107_cov_120.001187_16_plen_114_part_00
MTFGHKATVCTCLILSTSFHLQLAHLMYPVMGHLVILVIYRSIVWIDVDAIVQMFGRFWLSTRRMILVARSLFSQRSSIQHNMYRIEDSSTVLSGISRAQSMPSPINCTESLS